MLANLVRVSLLAKMLGISQPTARSWVRAAGFELVRSPAMGRSAAGSPCYVTTKQAVLLVDRMLPKALDRAANARGRRGVGRQAGRLRDSTRNISHAIGGTGADTLPLKPAL